MKDSYGAPARCANAYSTIPEAVIDTQRRSDDDLPANTGQCTWQRGADTVRICHAWQKDLQMA
jgi:hypothetical protein